MAKKTRREKELAELRRQLEVLKAQTKSYRSEPALSVSEETAEEPDKPQKELPAAKIRRVDPKFIKKDLLKTLILTAAAFALIALAVFLL